MNFSIKGTLEMFLPIETGNKKDGSGTWEKQNFLVRTDEQYNNLYCFEVFGNEKVANLTKYQKEGDTVTVTFSVNTNEYQGKYYTSLSAYRIEKGVSVDSEPLKSKPTKETVTTESDEEFDDLPF